MLGIHAYLHAYVVGTYIAAMTLLVLAVLGCVAYRRSQR